MLAAPFGGLRRVFQSPGPLLVPQGAEADYWRFAQSLFAAGFRAGDLVLCSVSYHLSPLGHIFDDAAAGLGCPVLPGGVGNTELQVGLLHSTGAVGYLGTPSFLKILLEKAAELGWRPGAGLGLRKALVAAEMLPESLRAAIERQGVSVRQAYGTADLGLLGYECPEKRGMHVPESAIVEIVDPATGQPLPAGEPGEVLATVDRRTYPLLRIGTGDLSALDESACTCGRTSPRLVRIMGRIGDAVKVRGMFVHPRQVDEVLSRFPEVQRCQLVVTNVQHRDQLAIRVEAETASADLGRRVEAELRQVIKVRGEVELVPAGTIAEGAKRIVDEREWD
jgi:phenylacetate-CoA ligase